MAERHARERKPKTPPPPKPWQRAEAGRYRSADGRFTLESGGGTWFVTDEETQDELGLARTTGPFATLGAAKAAAEAARERPVKASPLAVRIAEAAAGRVPAVRPEGGPPKRAPEQALKIGLQPDPSLLREPEPAVPRPTWLDELETIDRDAAVRARRLITVLEREGIVDAEALVRRDLLGGTPAVATRLLARAVLAAIADLRNPSAAAVAEAVAEALASSPKRGGLPGWQLAERDGPTGERRGLRLTADDLRAAAEDGPER